jgi:hypothetical protein
MIEYLIVAGLVWLAYSYYKNEKLNAANHYENVTNPMPTPQYLTEEQKEMGGDIEVTSSEWYEIKNEMAMNIQADTQHDPADDDPEGTDAYIAQTEHQASSVLHDV